MNRYNQMLWLADDDITKVALLEKVSVLDYYASLDKKIADVKRQIKQIEKDKTKTRR